MKYYFSSPQRTCALNNGLTRCFFNEEVKTETVTYTDPETEETRTDDLRLRRCGPPDPR